ncbi:hypothetical protein IVB12_16025 [Bradyrhizobium sp. 179]|uniref:hypothetical protein n=1 Tax=Bradyrhizobium sp. 179 TaxID=2782648 RepID=UPI001FF74647|nr:hypothetical protein [Bradyrhizobium sp. 179]MCK1543425.1 hypothetical protein [Bradyrhizobium sp. 179]
MSNPNRVVLDLDAIVPEKDVVLKLDNKEHPLHPVTVENFVKNMKTMEKLGTGALDTEQEKNLIVEMLEQVFPTVEKGRFARLTMIQLDQLLTFARANSGEEQVATEASENPPKAAA